MQNNAILRLQEADKNATVAKQSQHNFLPLEQETRSHVETACAAFHMTRKPQTMRAWACLENGPIRPIRINGRLAWAVIDLKRLLKSVG